MLGTGTPIVSPSRSAPALAVVVTTSLFGSTATFLVDAGPSVVRQLVQAEARGIRGMDVLGVQAVFLTHLHSDHTLGLVDLLLTPFVIGRLMPIKVFGPPGTRAMIVALMEAFVEDFAIRYETRDMAAVLSMHAEVSEVQLEPGLGAAPKLVYDAPGAARVSAFRVTHGAWKHAYGYRFDAEEDGRAIVVSGDTGASEAALVAACAGTCDVLVHEVFSERGLLGYPSSVVEYHRSYHTSTRDLAHIAVAARARVLVLTHMLFFGTPEYELETEMKTRLDEVGYAGRFVFPQDLDVL